MAKLTESYLRNLIKSVINESYASGLRQRQERGEPEPEYPPYYRIGKTPATEKEYQSSLYSGDTSYFKDEQGNVFNLRGIIPITKEEYDSLLYSGGGGYTGTKK